MRIDVHTHFQCLEFVKHLHGRSMMPKSLLDGGNYIIQCAAGLSVPALPRAVDMEKKLRDMEEMKIDAAVLSHGIPFGPDVLGGREAHDWAKRINDDLAGIIPVLKQIRMLGVPIHLHPAIPAARFSLRYQLERSSPYPERIVRRNA